MTRSCGNRISGGLYLSVPTSPFGMPVEYFLIDPTKITNLKPFRTPIIIEHKDKKVNDIAIWVGEQFYPFVSDFIEEAREQGISRRIPRNFPIEKLTPHKSKMFFIHSRAVPNFEYDTGRDCPRKIKHSNKPGDTCVFDLWHLSALTNFGEKHKVTIIDEDNVQITTPSVEYRTSIPRKPSLNLEQKKSFPYQTGIFCSFWVSHLEYINKEGKIPAELKKKIKKTDWDIKVMEE
jgi:hypothetical protein